MTSDICLSEENWLSHTMTAAEFSDAGLHKLTIDELLALSRWSIRFGRNLMAAVEWAANQSVSGAQPATPEPPQADAVVQEFRDQAKKAVAAKRDALASPRHANH